MNLDKIDKAGLIKYRLEQARATLRDAYSIHKDKGTPVSIVNRAYLCHVLRGACHVGHD